MSAGTLRPVAGHNLVSRFALGLGTVTALLMAVAVYMAFVYAPTDVVQGDAQRIFYVHVPVAWVAFLAAFVVLVCSMAYLWGGDQRWDQLARSSAEITLLFTSLTLLTGSLWGRPIWGTWWVWDARLTTTLLLWFMYLGYFMLRAYVGEPGRAARYAAVLGIVAFVDVPIIYESVNWWRTQHPTSVMDTPNGPAMPGSMLLTLLVAVAAFTLLYVFLMTQKYLIERTKDQLSEHQFLLAERAEQAEHARQLALMAESEQSKDSEQPERARLREGITIS